MGKFSGREYDACLMLDLEFLQAKKNGKKVGYGIFIKNVGDLKSNKFKILNVVMYKLKLEDTNVQSQKNKRCY